MFTLAVSCLTTLICLDSRTWHSRFLCNIALYSIRLCFYHQSHSQLGIVFFLAPSLHFFWSYFSFFSNSILGSGESSFSVLSFYLFMLFMGFSRQEYWSGLPFPSPVCHVLLKLSTMTCLSQVALHGMAHSFIELYKAVTHVISLVSFLWLWVLFCLPSDG